jgi:(1->4)-alpha-D-glucan 1-alpha-D-glucosylmutase
VAIPSSTYRLQLRREFTLHDAAAIVDYLAELGVGALYLSPVLQAASGSAHGYDTTDPTKIDHDRGGDAGLAELLAAADGAGLGVVIDIVPNHLGIAVPAENPAWWDVLRLGRESPSARWFDIDWSRDRILLPLLGDDATLQVVDGELDYAGIRFPLAPGSWQPGDHPDAVHGRQHYELVHYSRGNAEINYRRFFTITSLAGVRVEDEPVFAATHALVPDWVADGIAGLRVDHPDGLVDPGGYLDQLRGITPDQWLLVEKILEPGETLPASWPVGGSTGYDAMREVNGVFVDPAQRDTFDQLYRRLTGDNRTLEEHVEAAKRMVVTQLLPAEVRRMAALVPEIGDTEPALAEVAVAFDVYRSYLPDGADHLDRALALAEERRPELAPALVRLSARLHDPADELARRMQQLTGPTMAKGVEDTAYYRYARFVALNEVGGDPNEFGIPLARFHALQEARQRQQPESMTSLSTHDTKRSEDVRARLAVLTEIPDEWAGFASEFLTRTSVPSPSFGYFLVQTLAGTGPIDRARLHAYAEKAMREASEQTSWAREDADFEAAVHAAVDNAYDDPALRAAWDRIDQLIAAPGRSNALGQKLVQLTMPGVPDVYQGTELWDDSLVDPDNRRLVDYVLRRSMLCSVWQTGMSTAPAEPGSDPAGTLDSSGAAKLRVTTAALRLRRDRPELFSGYWPLHADGPASEHAIAFDRGGAITVATRLPVRLAATGGWRDTKLALDRSYTDVLTGRRYAGATELKTLLDRYPVALLATDS